MKQNPERKGMLGRGWKSKKNKTLQTNNGTKPHLYQKAVQFKWKILVNDTHSLCIFSGNTEYFAVQLHDLDKKNI